MQDILTIAFSNAVIILTTFFGLTIIYWSTVILGALDMGFLDFDLEPDYESDVSMDTDFDRNADGGAEPSSASRLL